MADPTPYQRSYSFSDFQANNPSQPLPGPQVDNELENIEQSLGETIDALADVRRADGALKNGIVTEDAFSGSLLADLDDRAAVAGAAAGTAAVAPIAAAALTYRDAAATSAAQALTYRNAASTSASAASASAGAAAGSAGTAATSAGQAMTFRNSAQSARDAALVARTQAESARDDAAGSAAEAADLVLAATSGFTGWPDDGVYDFGSITSTATYFDHDFGAIA